jgi:two-component system nitrate/nitrite sensor histidine kinase NarX
VTGLQAVIEEFRHNSMIDVELDVGDVSVEPDPTATTHLLGVVNEALSNVARHSGATRVVVRAETTVDGGLMLTIQDNGRGFDPSSVGSLGHQGLANMRSRVATIGATMEIASADTGTWIEIRQSDVGFATAEGQTQT